MGLTLNTDSLTIATPSTVAPDIGAYEFITQIVSTNASSIDFSNVFTTTYDIYKITATNVGGSASNINLLAKLEVGVGTFANYDNFLRLVPNNVSSFSYGGGNAFTYNQNNINSDAQRCNFTVEIYNPRSSNAKHAMFDGCGYSGFSNIAVNRIHTMLQATTTAEQTGIQFYPNSGTLTGTFRLYGFSKT